MRMDVAELVEDLMAYIPLPPSGSRVRSPEACLNHQPGPLKAFANVSALRADTGSLERVADDAARFFAGQGRADFLWFVGPHSRPDDTVNALMSLGATVVSGCSAMLLDHEPPSAPDVDIRPVTTAEHLLTCRLIGAAADGSGVLTDEQEAAIRAGNPAAWEDFTSYDGRRLNFLAHVDGEPVSAGGLLLTDHGVAVLSGGATLPAARGQGLYRALVHARWVAAQQLGAGPLAVQASPMSAPVLAQVGFTRLAAMTLLEQQTQPA